MHNIDDFDFFKDFSLDEQNTFLRKYLINDTKFLNPTPFPHSVGFYYYKNIFVDEQYHQNNLENLASLLLLLISREIILPICFSNNLKTPVFKHPLFVFASDIKYLDDSDFNSFEYFDIDEAAKVLEN